MLQFIKVFISFTAIASFAGIALCGWGLLFHRIAKYPVRNIFTTIAIGLATIVFLGGVLNLLRIAYGLVFDGLLVIGIFLALKYHKFLRPKLPRNKNEWFYTVTVGLVIIIIIVFTVQTQLPPKAFNFHDDFEKYFAHPVRMLQTGTLFGSPLSAIGTETLGGQAVLHGIVLNHFPIQYINGADAVFGLLLCLLLPVSLFPPRVSFIPISLISIFAVFAINPQYVNVSMLYIGSALIMTLILLYANINEDEKLNVNNLPSPVLLGLVYASLISAKPIFVVFSLVQVSVFIVVQIIYGRSVRQLILWGLNTIGMIILFILPWVILYLPYYINSSFTQIPNRPDIAPMPPLNLLSIQQLNYGGTFAFYTLVAFLPAVFVSVILFWKVIKKTNTNVLAGLAAGSIATPVAYLALLFLGPNLHGYNHSLRYSIPILIATAPIIFSLVYLDGYENKSFKTKLSLTIIPLLCGITIITIFSSSLINRINYAYKFGSIIVFRSNALPQEYTNYCYEVLYGDTKHRIASAQHTIPPGETAAVWVYAPFYLDYNRNTIFDAEPAGIASPWAHIYNSEYFMIEYNGLAVRSMELFVKDAKRPSRRYRYNSEMSIKFIRDIQNTRQNSDILYNDGKIIVFKKHKL